MGGPASSLPTSCAAPSRPFAASSLPSLTIRGTSEYSALSTKTSPAPTRRATTTSRAMDSISASTAIASAANSSVRASWTFVMSALRSTRSMMAPPRGPNRSQGSHTAPPTTATARGSLVIETASRGRAVTRIPSPTCETAEPAQNRQNVASRALRVMPQARASTRGRGSRSILLPGRSGSVGGISSRFIGQRRTLGGSRCLCEPSDL